MKSMLLAVIVLFAAITTIVKADIKVPACEADESIRSLIRNGYIAKDVVAVCNASVERQLMNTKISSTIDLTDPLTFRLAEANANNFWLRLVISIVKKEKENSQKEEEMTSYVEVCESKGDQTRCWNEKK